MMMTDEHLFAVLVKCHACPKFQNIYAGRWDVWCIQNGHLQEYLILILKTDGQINRLIARAKEVVNSPLMRAMNNEY
jgi:hypothetical protein